MTGEKPSEQLRSDDGAPASEFLSRGRGNYELLGEIARGGMGIVLRGHDTDLGRDVAVKILHDRLGEDPGALQRFIEEAQIGGQLQHPGVVPVYELGKLEDERPYFAMKLIEGRTLAELLGARDGLDEDRRRFLSIFEAVCQTVAYAHSKGVIHRDLKPDNIMVGAFGEVQVVDWGLAKVLNSEDAAEENPASPADVSVVQTVRSGSGSSGSESIVGSALGTPAYMPPEQALGDVEHVDERSDVFALGGILLEILTGAPPYVAGEGEHLVILAATAELGPARKRVEKCAADTELKQLVLDCLSQEPASRLGDAAEVSRRIQDFLSSLEEKAHRAELAATEAREARRRQKLSMVLGATVFTAVIAIGLVLRSVEQQRATIRLEQLAAAQGELDDATAEIAIERDAGRYEAALIAARDALAALDSKDLGDVAMTSRARRIVDRAEQGAQQYQLRQETERKNAALLAACDELRTRQIDVLVRFGATTSVEDLDAAYTAAFQQYGIDVMAEDLVATLEVLVTSDIGADVALALDDWAGLRRQIYGPLAFEVEAVAALAFDLDPDDARTRLREALLAGDEQAVLAFVREEDLSELPPATLWSLSQGLDSFGRSEELFHVVRDGAAHHPEDFLLNIRAGHVYGVRGAYAAAIGFLSTARGVRPDSAAVHALLGEYLRIIGDLPRAVSVYAEALRLNPDYTEVRNSMAWLQMELGDYAGAARSFGMLVERFPDVTVYDFRRLLAHFMMQDASLADVIERLESDESLRGRPESAAVWALLYHPDEEQRAPERVLAILNSWGYEEPATEAAEAIALLQLGRPAEALAVLDYGETLLGSGAVNVVVATSAKLRADYAVYRARAYYELGDRVRAVQYLGTAEQIMREFMYDGQEPWARTPLSFLYRQTAALLGR